MIRVWKQNGRLECDCGYRSVRVGHNEMADHVTLKHCRGTSPAQLWVDLQDLWFGKLKAVAWTLTGDRWKATREK